MQTLYKQLESLSGWHLCSIDASGIAVKWHDSFMLQVRGSNGSFTEVQCNFLNDAPSARALYNSARIPTLFGAASARSTSALPGLLQSAAVRLGRAETLLAEIKVRTSFFSVLAIDLTFLVQKLSGRHIAHQVAQEDTLRLIVDFSSSPSGGSNARTRFTVAFTLDAMYPFSDLAFELTAHFGDVTSSDVAAIVAAHTSFQRLTRICNDLQGIAQ